MLRDREYRCRNGISYRQSLAKVRLMNAPISPNQLRALLDMSLHDPDPVETAEWREAFVALAEIHGPERARRMLDELARQAR